MAELGTLSRTATAVTPRAIGVAPRPPEIRHAPSLRPLVLVDHGADLDQLAMEATTTADPRARFDVVHACPDWVTSVAWCACICLPVYDGADAERAGATLVDDVARRLPADSSVRTTLLSRGRDPVPQLRALISARGHDVIVAAAPRRRRWWSARPSVVERWLTAQDDVRVVWAGLDA